MLDRPEEIERSSAMTSPQGAPQPPSPGRFPRGSHERGRVSYQLWWANRSVIDGEKVVSTYSNGTEGGPRRMSPMSRGSPRRQPGSDPRDRHLAPLLDVARELLLPREWYQLREVPLPVDTNEHVVEVSRRLDARRSRGLQQAARRMSPSAAALGPEPVLAPDFDHSQRSLRGAVVEFEPPVGRVLALRRPPISAQDRSAFLVAIARCLVAIGPGAARDRSLVLLSAAWQLAAACNAPRLLTIQGSRDLTS